MKEIEEEVNHRSLFLGYRDVEIEMLSVSEANRKLWHSRLTFLVEVISTSDHVSELICCYIGDVILSLCIVEKEDRDRKDREWKRRIRELPLPGMSSRSPCTKTSC